MGARKLLDASVLLDHPVDSFMGWDASQSRLNSSVCLDGGDEDDGTWSGEIVDQFVFLGYGGDQADDAKDRLKCIETRTQWRQCG